MNLSRGQTRSLWEFIECHRFAASCCYLARTFALHRNFPAFVLNTFRIATTCATPYFLPQTLVHHSRHPLKRVFIASQSEPQLPSNDIQLAQQPTIVTPYQSGPSLPLALLGQSSSLSDANAESQASKDRLSSRAGSKKRCVVEGCLCFIAPSMWHAHMCLHIQGILPGAVPILWLEENDSYICSHCSQPVANSRMSSHSRKCSGVEITLSEIENEPSNSKWLVLQHSTICDPSHL